MMMKSLKWGNKSSIQNEEEKDHDHPMTVEFPSPMEETSNIMNAAGSALQSNSSDSPTRSTSNNAYYTNPAAATPNNHDLLRRISEVNSEDKSSTCNTTNDFTFSIHSEHDEQRSSAPYHSNNDEDHYRRGNSIDIYEEEDTTNNNNNELNTTSATGMSDSIAGDRYGGRPSMRHLSTDSQTNDENDSGSHLDIHNIPMATTISNKQRSSSSMNTFNRRSEREVVSAIKSGGIHSKGSIIGESDIGGGAGNNHHHEREEERQEGGEDRYDVRAAFEKEQKGECRMMLCLFVGEGGDFYAKLCRLHMIRSYCIRQRRELESI